MNVHDHLAGAHQTRVDRAVAAAEIPHLNLDPDGRPLWVVDLEGEPRKLTVWGMVCAQAVDGMASALVCSDTEDPPGPLMMRALADALVDDPNDPNLTPGSRAWEKARADAAELTARSLAEQLARVRIELARQASRVVELAEAGRERDAWRARLDHARRELGDARRELDQLPGLLAQVEALHADVDAAHQSARDVARLAVIALSNTSGKGRRSLAHLAHRTRRTP